MDNGKSCDYYGYSKAFRTGLSKLGEAGYREIAGCRINKYADLEKQCRHFGNYDSLEKLIAAGVPKAAIAKLRVPEAVIRAIYCVGSSMSGKDMWLQYGLANRSIFEDIQCVTLGCRGYTSILGRFGESNISGSLVLAEGWGRCIGRQFKSTMHVGDVLPVCGDGETVLLMVFGRNRFRIVPQISRRYYEDLGYGRDREWLDIGGPFIFAKGLDYAINAILGADMDKPISSLLETSDDIDRAVLELRDTRFCNINVSTITGLMLNAVSLAARFEEPGFGSVGVNALRHTINSLEPRMNPVTAVKYLRRCLSSVKLTKLNEMGIRYVVTGINGWRQYEAGCSIMVSCRSDIYKPELRAWAKRHIAGLDRFVRGAVDKWDDCGGRFGTVRNVVSHSKLSELTVTNDHYIELQYELRDELVEALSN